MRLSPHFTLSELTKSQTAERMGINNAPGEREVEALKLICQRVLEPVRERFGPFTPSSGYRSLKLNKAVGGARTSQHVMGEAADFEVPGISNVELAEWIRDNLKFDQLILEFYVPGRPSSGWVHCSFSVYGLRNQVLTAVKGGGIRVGISP